MTQPLSIRACGTFALLAEYASLDDALSAADALRDDVLAGVTELVPAARTVLVRFTPEIPADAVRRWIAAASGSHTVRDSSDVIGIDVVYDGEDLAEVAALLDISPDEVIARHTAAHYRVAFGGFAPGFAYLVAPNAALDVPRRSSPRPRIPAGAVGLAGEFSGIYPRATPGGWQLIGTTAAVLWDDARPQPALLSAGASVRFRAVRELIELTPTHATTQRTAPGVAVLVSGPQLTVQDRGRPGLAAAGVTRSGAMDPASHDAANRAVGNAADAATLEITLGGAELAVQVPAVFAVAGADMPITLAADEEYTVVPGVPFAAPAGATISFGYATNGTRAYLAVRGGFQAREAAGSRSTDTLSGMGPAPLAPGAVLAIGAQPRTAVRPQTPPAMPTGSVTLDITLGPRDDWFTASAIETLTTQPWRVSPVSDRVGTRLAGDEPLERANHAELPSEGVVRGAIQVPADGQPVLFQADHPVTGGYPVIAVVAAHHLALAGQLAPGTAVWFRIIGERATPHQ